MNEERNQRKVTGVQKNEITEYLLSKLFGLSFKKKRFMEMAGVRLGIAALTFVIGFFIRAYFGIEIIKHVP
ncbi:MAG: hypothetical protein KGY45_01895 [Hadesarchaea archaeon]|nr:hypothetical protein [Hadesarchaea archaeon]